MTQGSDHVISNNVKTTDLFTFKNDIKMNITNYIKMNDINE